MKRIFHITLITYFIFLAFGVKSTVAFCADKTFSPQTSSASTNLHVYVIVDPHGDPAGQIELSRMLLGLIHEKNLSWVGLEAATGDVSLAFLRQTAPASRRMTVATRYLKASYLHGAEWATLMDGGDFELWGVENPALYDRTIRLYRRVAELRSEALRQMASAKEVIRLSKAASGDSDMRRRVRRVRALANLSQSFLTSPWEYLKNPAFLDAMSRRYYLGLTRGINRILRDRFPNRTDLLMTGRAMQDLVVTLKEFDDLSRQRNREFVSRTLEEMGRRSVSESALIIGAIHIPQTVRLLEERGVNCTVIRPRISERVNAYRYERLLIRQPLFHDALHMPLAAIPRLALRLPQATLLRPLLAQVWPAVQLKREPMLFRFAEALGPDAVRAVESRIRQGIGEGLVSDALSEEETPAAKRTAAAADASGYIAFKAHLKDIEQLKDSRIDTDELARGIYGSLAQYARSLREAAELHRPEVHSSAMYQLDDKPEVRMDTAAWDRAMGFLLTNTTSSGLPLSYRAPKDYWADPTHDLSDRVDGVIERQIVANTVNIYDAAVWQIVLQLDGGKKSRHLAGDFTRRLIRGSSGSIQEIRAWEEPYRYGDERIKIRRDNAFIFRTIADTWFQEDPKDGKEYLPGFPNDERLHHEDWKPITGEQAWAGIIGPLQSAYIKNSGWISSDSKEASLGFNLIPALEAMQSPIGAIYHAPWGTHGKDPRDISNENNYSMLAALRMLQQVASMNGSWHEASRIQWLTRGIEAYFKDYSFDAENGVFYQGGFFMGGEFVPNPVFAVDCQTWGIAVLGPEWIDKTFGKGTAYRIWQNTKARSGVYDADGRLEGVGFTDSRDVVSVEWTAGAILCAKVLADYYDASRPAWAEALRAEARSMRAAMEQFKVRLDDGSEAYFYANRRFFIPFGWWANPIPSLVSTAWIMLLDKDFDPFILGGGKIAPSAERPQAPFASPVPLQKIDTTPAESRESPRTALGNARLLLNVFLPPDTFRDRPRSVQLRCRGDLDGEFPAEMIILNERGVEVLRKTITWSARGKNWESQPIYDMGAMRDVFTPGSRHQLILYAAAKNSGHVPRIFWQLRVDSDRTPRA